MPEYLCGSPAFRILSSDRKRIVSAKGLDLNVSVKPKVANGESAAARVAQPAEGEPADPEQAPA